VNDRRAIFTVRTPRSVTVFVNRAQAIAQKRVLADAAYEAEIERHVIDVSALEKAS